MQLIKASLENISELRRICIDGYSTYFHDYWNENGLEWYLDKQFSYEKLKYDLNDESIDYYFIKVIDKPVGFIKINHNSILNVPFERSSEMEKMYILPKYKGKGIGKKALNEVIKIIQKRRRKILFLDVLDTNTSAIDFYKKNGFNFHSNKRLDLPYFKDELRGINLMFLELNQ
jgi:ribosomal protein S18 acetylase RimI-like enzyme